MRILLCPSTPISPELGASKVYIEVAEGFRRLGWDCTLAGPEEVALPRPPGDIFQQPERLRSYLLAHAADYDVVEFEHHQLPFPRRTFPSRPLLVARSVLLSLTQLAAGFPSVPNLRGRLRRLVRSGAWRRRMERIVEQTNRTFAGADLVNVCNTHERDAVLAAGHVADKVVVLPFGLFRERLDELSPAPAAPEPIIAYVGTFDPRKGMNEFPALVREVLAVHPTAQFRLLGTAGLVSTSAEVLAFFPRSQRPHLTVTPRFKPSALPALLAGCSAGVFPSHCEGFPFAVLELLGAGLPVFAYDAPGAPMLLGPEFLAPRGDGVTLGRRLARLLSDPQGLGAARRAARARAEQFPWEASVRQTAELYASRVAQRSAPDATSNS